MEISITDARDRLSTLVDDARRAPVTLTRRGRAVAAIVDADRLTQLLEDAEELADIRAAEAADDDPANLAEAPIPWDEVRRDLGLT